MSGFSFAYAQLRFLGFSFGLSFIQESYSIILNRNYSKALLLGVSSSSDGRVRRAIASKVVDLGIIPSPVKPKNQKSVFTASLFDAQH